MTARNEQTKAIWAMLGKKKKECIPKGIQIEHTIVKVDCDNNERKQRRV